MSATKEQERQAIGMIKKTIMALGGDSYIAAAMEGVLELAEQNIEYDQMCSMADRVERAEEREKKANDKVAEQAEQIAQLQKELKECDKQLQSVGQLADGRAKKIMGLTMPSWAVEDVIKNLRKEEEGQIDYIGSVSDQMAEYALAMFGDESEEIKKGYQLALKEDAANYQQAKEKMEKTQTQIDYFELYLNELKTLRGGC